MKQYNTVEEAIEAFYENNLIDPDIYISDENEAYIQNKECDYLIGKDIFSLHVNEWLQSFSNSDINIFLNLLGNYTYITRREYRHKISLLSESTFATLNALNIPFSDAIFITTPSPKGLKSGGDEIRSYFNSVNICRGIKNNQIICSQELVSPDIFKDKTTIIFIDDLIGSGKTIKASIEKLLKYFQNNNIDSSMFQIFFAGIFVNNSASKNIIKHFNSLNVTVKPIYMELPKKLLKGDVIFDSKEFAQVISVIKKYEDLIDAYQFNTSFKTYSMGFDKCKLTVSFYYNTPNNTLCNFWEYSDTHIPLFERRTQSVNRPTVNELKNRKSNNTINAYLQKAKKNESI